MELEDYGQVEVEGRVLEKELVGRKEYIAEGKKGERKGKIRLANFDDLDAIMDINDNVYGGFDYMPALFYTFMHSKLHAIYVCEEDGKLISLVNLRFHTDCDDLVSGMSIRVRPSYQGRGLGASVKSPVATHILKKHPVIMRYVVETMYTPNIAAKMNQLNVLYHWNILVYKLDDRQWLSRFTRIRQMAFGAVPPFSLSYTDATEWLERSDQLVRFVSKYVGDFFPSGPNLMPTTANRAGLRHVLSVAKVFISLDAASTSDNSCFSGLISSIGTLPAEDWGPQRTMDRGQESDITGLSYSTVVSCKYGLRIDIYFYGDCEKIISSHVYSHLLHYVSITSDDVRFGVQLHFPLTIDSRNVEERLKEGIGEWLDTVTQAVQYIADIPQAKL